MERLLTEQDFLSCCGSTQFARQMSAAAPFADLTAAVAAARDIWLNTVDVNGYLEAFAAHPQIGSNSNSISKWSKEEQSAAAATATDLTLQELIEWNARYREKFGFVFLICASGRGTPEILAELKRRYSNRPIVELEIASQEQLKILELRLARLFGGGAGVISPVTPEHLQTQTNKAGDRIGIIGAHLTASSNKPPSIGIIGAHLTASSNKPPKISGGTQRTRPPITTHVLDVSRGSPAAGIEVHLEMWKGAHPSPSLNEQDSREWVFLGSSVTNSDGRSGPLMGIVDHINPGIYRISFNTGKYEPSGFFPYVSIVFDIKESQRSEHFHVPLLFSPFSITTYRGS